MSVPCTDKKCVFCWMLKLCCRDLLLPH